MGDRSKLGVALLLVVAAGCGGGSSAAGRGASEPSAPDTPSSISKHSPPPAADDATPPSSPPAAPPSAADDDDDPNESAAPIAMPALVAKGAHPSFPKSSAGDKDCWQTLNVSGKHQNDYDAIVSHCGAPTGMIEYAKPVTGHLHHLKDKRDTYRLELRGGLCYRYFAVADSAITDLDILVETTSGALVASDQLHGPIAIIDAGKPWCQSEDTTLDFHVQVGGTGHGKYAFGVWARPKP